MKASLKITAVLIILLTGFAAYGEVYEAAVEGMKVKVLNINLKKQFSSPIGASSPNKQIDLTEGVSGSIGSIEVEEADQDAYELSFDFSNIEIPLKAYAFDGTEYHFTTPGGISSSTSSDSSTWTDYGYMNIPKISPDRTDGRVVVQSYFPEAVYIEAGDSFTVTGNVDLDYTVLFWDGDNSGLPSNTPFAYYPELYPSGTPAFAAGVPDIVLAINTSLTKETYAFSTDSADLSPMNMQNCRIIALFFDTSGDLYDGAGKYFAGYNAGGSTWARAKGVVRNGDGTYNLKLARNYSESAGVYIFDVISDNSFVRLDLDQTSGSSTVNFYDPSLGSLDYYYKRIE